jgi:chromosome segregation ATPase
MTPEELQQIQAIIQAAVAPLATKQEIQALETKIAAVETKIGTVETKLEKTEQTLRTEIQTSEQKLMEKLNKIELLAADYLDGQVQTTKRRLDRVEKILNITP